MFFLSSTRDPTVSTHTSQEHEESDHTEAHDEEDPSRSRFMERGRTQVAPAASPAGQAHLPSRPQSSKVRHLQMSFSCGWSPFTLLLRF